MQKVTLIVLALIYINTISSQSTTTLNLVNNTDVTITNSHPDYPATPGDIYSIDFLTANSDKQIIRAFVDSDFNISLSFIGTVNVRGLKYTEVQNRLKAKISASYPGAIVNVMILAPGKFRVTLLGEVKEASIVEAMSITTLAEVIKDKTTSYASIRNIEIKSEDGSVKEYDLFKFIRYADLTNNPFLKPNDVITVKPYDRMVKIEGEIKRPGVYQLVKEDTLLDLINFYGDNFTKRALQSEIVIKRYIGESNTYKDSTKYIDGTTTDLSTITLHDSDIVTIKDQLTYISKIYIQGAVSPKDQPTSSAGNNVSNKIYVPITSGSRVSTALTSMNGSFNLTSDLEKAILISGSEKTNINVKSILENSAHPDDLVLKDGDIIIIPFRQYKVFIAGSVNSPGAVPFIEYRTADYYIGLAGGYNIAENSFRSYSIRNVYGEKLSNDTIISPEDVIFVNKDNPIAYLEEYGGYITTVLSTFFIVKGLYDLGDAISNGEEIPSSTTILP